jgi:hypothetical protein
MMEWLFSFDWSWLFGVDGINIAVEVVFVRAVASVTGVASGKRYGEIVFDTIVDPDGGDPEGYTNVGIINTATPTSPRVKVAMGTFGRIWFNGAQTTSPNHTDGPTFIAGNVAMFAVDTATGKVWIGKVGTGWYASGDPAAGTGEAVTLSLGTYYLCSAIERVSVEPIGGSKFSLRTQASQFTGSIPSGFSAWYP